MYYFPLRLKYHQLTTSNLSYTLLDTLAKERLFHWSSLLKWATRFWNRAASGVYWRPAFQWSNLCVWRVDKIDLLPLRTYYEKKGKFSVVSLDLSTGEREGLPYPIMCGVLCTGLTPDSSLSPGRTSQEGLVKKDQPGKSACLNEESGRCASYRKTLFLYSICSISCKILTKQKNRLSYFTVIQWNHLSTGRVVHVLAHACVFVNGNVRAKLSALQLQLLVTNMSVRSCKNPLLLNMCLSTH